MYMLRGHHTSCAIRQPRFPAPTSIGSEIRPRSFAGTGALEGLRTLYRRRRSSLRFAVTGCVATRELS